MVRHRDFGTLDIFRDYTPPEPVAAQLDPDLTKGGTLDVQISRIVGHAMAQSGKTRAEIAAEMSEYLGFPPEKDGLRPNGAVTENMLDTYASPARREHKITLERFIALIEVTGCYDLLAFVCRPAGFVAVPERYADIIEIWREDREIEERTRRRDTLAGRVRGLR